MVPGRHRIAFLTATAATTLGFILLNSCSRVPNAPPKTATAAQELSPPSTIHVEVKPGGPLVITTSAAEFEILSNGYVQASLLANGEKLSLDDPGAAADSFFVHVSDQVVRIPPNLQQAEVHEAAG